MKKFLILVVIIFVIIQFIPIDKTNPINDDKLALIVNDKEVKNLLKTTCYDCHSNHTVWPNYSNIAPFSFVISNHVKDGRKAINFSEYENIKLDIKKKRVERAIQLIKNQMMPPSSYTWIHKDAILNKEQKDKLINFFQKELNRL